MTKILQMKEPWNLYGIPSCQSVRKARAWLEQHQVAYQFHDLRENTPSSKQLMIWAHTLGWEQLLNKKSTSFRNLPDTDKHDINKAWALNLMEKYPTLIKRPVLERGEDIHLGFHPESYEAWFA